MIIVKYSNYLFLVIILLTTTINAQDKIFLKSGEKIEAKIIEVNLNDIKYKKFSNLEGPLRTIIKDAIHMVLYENGESEMFSTKDYISLEKTKGLIIEYFDKYAYTHHGDFKYTAIFDNDYLRLLKAPRSRPKDFLKFNYVYDFTDYCGFHNLSKRAEGIVFINVYVNIVIKNKYGEYRKKIVSPKLAIRVEGYENGKVLRDALIRYNEYFQ